MTSNCEFESEFKLRLLNPEIEKEKFNDDGLETPTSLDQVLSLRYKLRTILNWTIIAVISAIATMEQTFSRTHFKKGPQILPERTEEVEKSIEACSNFIRSTIGIDPRCPKLEREEHIHFLKKGLGMLSNAFEPLDVSRPWMCYWIIHSLSLLGESLSKERKKNVIEFLKLCQHPDGGFGGSPGLEAHLAPTYAAVNALCILQTEEAYAVIDRPKLLEYLLRMKNPDGSYRMHESSEVDIRGAYCALLVARMTSLWVPELFENTADWIASCQTYEGGFGGVPFMEAHGGYTFCGFAALVLLKKENMCNISSLLRWLVNRQMRYEGGFQGRTNKLVDSCYSFWQSATFPLLHRILCVTENDTMSTNSWLFDQAALQEYLLVNCQASCGGMIDKPGRRKDFYHTCYALSGLSVAQHFAGDQLAKIFVVGDPSNELNPTHPISNIIVEAVSKAAKYFQDLPIPEYKSPER